MKKVTFLCTLIGLTMSISLLAKLPNQRDTTSIKAIQQVNNENKEGFISPDEELFLIDSASLGIGGEEAPVRFNLYDSWNYAMSDPYNLPIDEVIKPHDTIALAIENFTFPLLKHYRVNSEFGKRGSRFHNGIDLRLYKGEKVVASMAGKVRVARYSGAFGNLVVIRHNNGLETFYGHLSKLMVKPDQMVESGEVIGLGGSTGRSTGAHLHYEVRYLGKAINPRNLVDFDSTLTAKSDTLLLTAELFNSGKKPYSTSTNKSVPVLQAGQGGIWTVSRGDTLSRIAQRTGTTISYLCNVNGISSSSVLKLGQKLKY